jgi:cyclopropane fatty-acyl-phospholipid synthase-like methyltransferase
MAATPQHAIKNHGRNSGKKGRNSMARKADRHVLYEDSVQCVEAEIDFVDATFKELRNRKARLLREDFCGTANTSCEWARRRKRNRAIAVDLDAEVQEWGRTHHLAKLGRAKKHVTLLNENVLDVKTEPVDIILAMNFSYWIFKERAVMRHYFRSVYSGLAEDGVFFLDAYGGSDAYKEMRERTKYDDFTYIWDQASFDPISGDMVCNIHFSFPDGSRMKKAFTYEWRLWSLPEIREILLEAGFKRVTVYWQGDDEDSDEGDGEFEPAEYGDADEAWIVYISAER